MKSGTIAEGSLPVGAPGLPTRQNFGRSPNVTTEPNRVGWPARGRWVAISANTTKEACRRRTRLTIARADPPCVAAHSSRTCLGTPHLARSIAAKPAGLTPQTPRKRRRSARPPPSQRPCPILPQDPWYASSANTATDTLLRREMTCARTIFPPPGQRTERACAQREQRLAPRYGRGAVWPGALVLG